MAEILLSIVIPTFNSEKTIGKCLSSIPRRDYVEVIVVDDFSSDSTVKICERFDAKVYQTRSTIGGARNYGAGRSKGKYVVRLDSDETISGKIFDELVRKLKSEKPDIVLVPRIGLGYWHGVETAVHEHAYFHLHRKSARPVSLDIMPLVFDRNLFMKYRQNERMQYGEDMDQLTRMKPQIKKVIALRNPIYHLPKSLKKLTRRRMSKSAPPLPLFRERYQENAMFYANRYLYILKKHPKYLPGAIILAIVSSLGYSIRNYLI